MDITKTMTFLFKYAQDKTHKEDYSENRFNANIASL